MSTTDTPYLDPADTGWPRRRSAWVSRQIRTRTAITFAINVASLAATLTVIWTTTLAWSATALGLHLALLVAVTVWHTRTINYDRLAARWHAANGRLVDENHPWWTP